MFEHHLPKAHDLSYHPPRKHVLLLSCMDPRLLDDVVDFMNHDNLTNRYDHLILAGAALGALGGPDGSKPHWKQTFLDQIHASIVLHKTQDIYIVEHRNCGAYEKVFDVHGELTDSDADQTLEYDVHRRYAAQLAEELRQIVGGDGKPLRVKTFLMDLRGRTAPFIEARSPAHNPAESEPNNTAAKRRKRKN
ncbi:MAG TPA: hypothetical protein VGN57_00365 [Pirellulaceae bacterium]|jgi:hypothetical protein|nr:hypothetical protein [Pirellulaceae bacterium]